MTFEEELIKLRDSGFLSEMLKRGLISYKPLYYLDIYNDKVTKKLSNKELASRLNVTQQTIRNALRPFNI